MTEYTKHAKDMNMKVSVSIKRQDNNLAPYTKEYEADIFEKSTVADLLNLLNEQEDNPIDWECSCLQKLCGACAMNINGRPQLACNTFIENLGTEIVLEPLAKMEVIRDLRVDRTALRKQFEEAEIWIKDRARTNQEEYEWEYLSATCLRCGCCLSICPRYKMDENFIGAAALNGAYRIAVQQPEDEEKLKLFRKLLKGGEGCCYFACEDVCPAKIPLIAIRERLAHILE